MQGPKRRSCHSQPLRGPQNRNPQKMPPCLAQIFQGWEHQNLCVADEMNWQSPSTDTSWLMIMMVLINHPEHNPKIFPLRHGPQSHHAMQKGQMSGAPVIALYQEPFRFTTLPLPILAHHSILFHQMHNPKVITVGKPAEHMSPLSHSDQNVVSSPRPCCSFLPHPKEMPWCAG